MGSSSFGLTNADFGLCLQHLHWLGQIPMLFYSREKNPTHVRLNLWCLLNILALSLSATNVATT